MITIIIIIIAGILMYFMFTLLRDDHAVLRKPEAKVDYLHSQNLPKHKTVKKEVQMNDIEDESEKAAQIEVAKDSNPVELMQLSFSEEFAIVAFSQLVEDLQYSPRFNQEVNNLVKSHFLHMFNIPLNRFDEESFHNDILNNYALMVSWEYNFEAALQNHVTNFNRKEFQKAARMWISETFEDLEDLYEDHKLYPSQFCLDLNQSSLDDIEKKYAGFLLHELTQHLNNPTEMEMSSQERSEKFRLIAYGVVESARKRSGIPLVRLSMRHTHEYQELFLNNFYYKSTFLLRNLSQESVEHFVLEQILIIKDTISSR